MLRAEAGMGTALAGSWMWNRLRNDDISRYVVGGGRRIGSSGGACGGRGRRLFAEVAHGHSRGALEHRLEVAKTFVAAVLDDLRNRLAGGEEAALGFLDAAGHERGQNRSGAVLLEAQVKEPAGDAEVGGDVVHADSIAGVCIDIGEDAVDECLMRRP